MICSQLSISSNYKAAALYRVFQIPNENSQCPWRYCIVYGNAVTTDSAWVV